MNFIKNNYYTQQNTKKYTNENKMKGKVAEEEYILHLSLLSAENIQTKWNLPKSNTK